MLETGRVGILSLKSLPPHSTYSTGIPLHLSVQVLCSYAIIIFKSLPPRGACFLFSNRPYLLEGRNWFYFFCSHLFIHTMQGESPLGAKHGTAELVDMASVLRRQTVLSGGLLPKNKCSCILTGRHSRHRNKPREHSQANSGLTKRKEIVQSQNFGSGQARRRATALKKKEA